MSGNIHYSVFPEALALASIADAGKLLRKETLIYGNQKVRHPSRAHNRSETEDVQTARTAPGTLAARFSGGAETTPAKVMFRTFQSGFPSEQSGSPTTMFCQLTAGMDIQ
jgi:hypothetical protein